MQLWRFFDYVSETSRNYVDDWLGGLSIQAQEDFFALLTILRKEQQWKHEPYYKALHLGKTRGIGELRFQGDRKQLRVMGSDGKTAGSYVLFLGCSHKGKVYDPPSAFDTTVKRKKDFDLGKGRLRER